MVLMLLNANSGDETQDTLDDKGHDEGLEKMVKKPCKFAMKSGMLDKLGLDYGKVK